jgi:L-lactate dehydrogenase complex protein LldE
MVRHGYGMLMAKEPFPCFELCEFLVRELGISRWPAKAATSAKKGKRVAFHRSCHGRVLHLGTLQRDLAATIPGIELVEFGEEEQCCGFGGAFSVTHATISSGIGMAKLEQILAAGANEIVGGDMGCLMHLDGLIRKNELPLKVRHVAELLAEAIP